GTSSTPRAKPPPRARPRARSCAARTRWRRSHASSSGSSALRAAPPSATHPSAETMAQDPQPKPFERSELESLALFASADRAELERYKFHASVDALTGLFNRYWIDKMLARQMERSRGAREALSLLLIDVDQFKQFNDRHGHVAGDCALRSVATCMRGALRP